MKRPSLRDRPNEVDTWINRSFALHELKRVKEAEVALLPALVKFPDEPLVPYNLACFACLQGKIEEARRLLESAFALGDEKRLKLQALDEPDLERLWLENQKSN